MTLRLCHTPQRVFPVFPRSGGCCGFCLYQRSLFILISSLFILHSLSAAEGGHAAGGGERCDDGGEDGDDDVKHPLQGFLS